MRTSPSPQLTAPPTAPATPAAGVDAPIAAHVHVVDTGIRIPADELEAVFEPFVQVRSDFARGMGGDVRARSVEGAGSTFTVTLRRHEGR